MLALDSSNLCAKPLLVSVAQPYLFEFFVGELWSGLDFVAWEDPFEVHPEQIVQSDHDAKQFADKDATSIIAKDSMSRENGLMSTWG